LLQVHSEQIFYDYNLLLNQERHLQYYDDYMLLN
jgi:hypothetical protein